MGKVSPWGKYKTSSTGGNSKDCDWEFHARTMGHLDGCCPSGPRPRASGEKRRGCSDMEPRGCAGHPGRRGGDGDHRPRDPWRLPIPASAQGVLGTAAAAHPSPKSPVKSSSHQLYPEACRAELRHGVLSLSQGDQVNSAYRKVKSLSHVQLFVNLWTVSMGFFRQEYWRGLPFPSPGDLPEPGIEPSLPC